MSYEKECCGYCFGQGRNACDISDGACWYHWSKYNREVQDRAREWVNEHYPWLDGSAYDEKLSETCRELTDIDRAADKVDRGSFRYGG